MSDIFIGENQPAQRTTPTWETELLISGATVFGLMQLPNPLNRALIVLMNGNEQIIVSLLRTMGIYLQFSLISLILAFVLHLLARGYWVALVGLNSVYPEGIRWDKKTSGGPIYRETGKAEMGSIPSLIELADNRATRIFGLGFGMAMAMTVASLIVGGMVTILMIVQATHGDLELWNTIVWSIVAILILPFSITYLIDYQFGEKLKASGKDTLIRTIFSRYRYIGIGSTRNPIMAVYTTNAGVKKTTIMMILVMTPFMFAIAAFTATRGMSIDNGAYDGLPKNMVGAEHVIRPEYYATSRGEEYSTTLVPYIDDSVVSGNYLKLFIPYQPNRYNDILEEQCSGALKPKAAQNGEGLNCLAKLFNIQIDGKMMTAPLLAGTDAATGQRGMTAMIDIRTLSEGQHELKVKSLPKASAGPAKTEEKFHLIPFWK